MARRYSYRGRYYGKRKSASVRATTFSRKFKASAANMTQNGLYNISDSGVFTVKVINPDSSGQSLVDIAEFVWKSQMHRALSNVFDQYKIDKIQIKLTPFVTPNDASTSATVNGLLFTCIDRTGFATGATYAELMTYGSFSQTAISLSSSENSTKSHYVRYGQTGIVGRSQYFDTKLKATFPHCCVGVKIPLAPGTTAGDFVQFNVAYEIDAQVRYRGVRFDGRSIPS